MTMAEAKLTGEVSKVDRSIDRLKTCPLLLRVFCNKNRHHLARLVFLLLFKNLINRFYLGNMNKDIHLKMNFKFILGWMQH
jgi:hypothetical protein